MKPALFVKTKDNTVAIVKAYIEEHHLQGKWTLIENEKNLGYANNFHKAMSLAKGEYIFFADQDDIWCLDKIEEMVRVMEENPKIQLSARFSISLNDFGLN